MTTFYSAHEKIEQLTYTPDVKDTTDLEAATTAISAAAEPGADNYSAALTLGAPSDARLVVLRVANRIAVTIDSFNAGAAHLYCRVYVDTVDADHRLFDLDLIAPAAQKLSAVDTQAANKAVIFAALKDGGAHTFKFRLWVDAGNVVVSEVRLWEGVGSSATGVSVQALRLDHTGLVTLGFQAVRTGTGNLTAGWEISDDINTTTNRLPDVSGSNTGRVDEQLLVKTSAFWCTKSTVATDLVYLYKVLAHLRSES